MSRCTGHCCRAFPLPLTPEEIADPEHMARFIDGPQIAAMVRYIGPAPPGSTGGHHSYSCTSLTDSGDCGIYEDRPVMCRDFPYGRTCTVDGCTRTPDPPG